MRTLVFRGLHWGPSIWETTTEQGLCQVLDWLQSSSTTTQTIEVEYMSSVFLVVEPSKIIFLNLKYYTPKGVYNLTLYWVP